MYLYRLLQRSRNYTIVWAIHDNLQHYNLRLYANANDSIGYDQRWWWCWWLRRRLYTLRIC